MSNQQEPKKPRRPKSKRLKLTISERDKWKQILAEVEKAEAPVSVLRAITVNLIDGTKVEIDIQELLSEGFAPDDLEAEINEKLHNLDSIIKNVDFFISIDHVAKAVQPFTDSLLKNL
jgi:hypothetical protein